MGASQFVITKIGRYLGAGEAFWESVEQAKHWHGHSGYTGTIAEKQEFIRIERPLRKDPWKFVEELFEAKDPRINDKWGPAGCIEITGTYLSKLKIEEHLKPGIRGVRAYIFFGWASD